MAEITQLEDQVDRILEECGFRANPYLVSLEQGGLEPGDFAETQRQFYHAVVFFNRPMSVLAGRIPSSRLRAEILRNVWEEHGEGDPERAHGATFRLFLERLTGESLTARELDRRAPWPEVRLFNTVLAGACALDDYRIAAAMMGMIERMFCEISGRIGRAVVARGWIPASRLVHYDLHEELDVRHAQDFLEVVRPAWESGPAGRDLVLQGLRLGATCFDGLYAGLYKARRRRELPRDETAGPAHEIQL